MRHRTSDIRYRTSDIKHPTSDVRHQTSDIRIKMAVVERWPLVEDRLDCMQKTVLLGFDYCFSGVSLQNDGFVKVRDV